MYKKVELHRWLIIYHCIQIEYILSKFPRQNLYIGISEEIKQNKLIEYNKIITFLGSKKMNNINNVDTHIGTYKKKYP